MQRKLDSDPLDPCRPAGCRDTFWQYIYIYKWKDSKDGKLLRNFYDSNDTPIPIKVYLKIEKPIRTCVTFHLRSLIKYKTREREKGENSNSGPKKSVLEGMGPPISSSNAGPKGMRRSTHQAARTRGRYIPISFLQFSKARSWITIGLVVRRCS